MLSLAPQLAKIWREKDASFLVTVAGFSLWTAYGVLIGRSPLVAANAVCVAMSGAVLALKLRFDRSGDTS